ncbi:hypothetical protein GCM10010344_66580 [Streptomyces bluensis]|nr:carbon starvation CstA 5TM domain-containing protein [Streptomyces bluensis]GGZ89665.1 hypothetical protein GCM10010344_66580 [Streptomyces bluensis]
MGAHEPLGGINRLFPIFGISNQLLAAVTLAVCTTLLVKSGRVNYPGPEVPGLHNGRHWR